MCQNIKNVHKIFLEVEILYHKPQIFSVKIINCLGLQYVEKFLIFLRMANVSHKMLCSSILFSVKSKQTNNSFNENFMPSRVRTADKGKGVPLQHDSPCRDSCLPGNGHLDWVSICKDCAAGRHGGGKGKGEMTEMCLRISWREMGVQHRQVTVLCRTEQGFTPLHRTPTGSAVPLRWVEKLNVLHVMRQRKGLCWAGRKYTELVLPKKCQPCRPSQGAWHILPWAHPLRDFICH